MSRGVVLIVDDEENIRKILGAMLKAEGHEVALARNLTEAKDALRTKQVEVVLTGFEVGARGWAFAFAVGARRRVRGAADYFDGARDGGFRGGRDEAGCV